MSDFCVKIEEPTEGKEIIEVLENSKDIGGFTIEVLDREVLDLENIEEAHPTTEKTVTGAPIPSMNFPKKDGLQFVARKKAHGKLESFLAATRLKRMNAAAFEIKPGKKYTTLAENSSIGYKSRKPVRKHFEEQQIRDFESFARELNMKLGYQIDRDKNYASEDLQTDDKYSDGLYFKGTRV